MTNSNSPPPSPTSIPPLPTATPTADTQRLTHLEQLLQSLTDTQQREREARRGLELEVQQMRAQAAMQLDAIAQQHREEAAQAEMRRQEDQALFETKLSTAISMSAHVTQTISQQVSNLTQLITGLSLPAPPPAPTHEPTDSTLPTTISTAWLTGQLKLRSNAWRMLNPANQHIPPSSQHHQLLAEVRDEFRRSMARDITLSDIPHYRDTELNPDPNTVSLSDYINTIAKYIRIHFAAVNTRHGMHPADPRHPSLLRRYQEQDQLRNQALIAILLPPEEPDEVDFRAQFESQYGREPQPEDIPRWPDIPYILPDTTPISEQDISEYHQTIRSVMLSQPIPPPSSSDYPPPPPTSTATSPAKTLSQSPLPPPQSAPPNSHPPPKPLALSPLAPLDGYQYDPALTHQMPAEPKRV